MSRKTLSRKTFSQFKLQGEWAELLFMARASELGLTLVRPWGDSLPYDVALVVDSLRHHGGRAALQRRVGQSKSARALAPDRARAGLQRRVTPDRKSPSHPALLRIQIKSTRCRHSDGAYKCHIDSNGVAYTLHELDFIAAYVIPAKVWYIIPLAATRGQTEVLLAPNRPHSKYAVYKEAWHLLRNGS